MSPGINKNFIANQEVSFFSECGSHYGMSGIEKIEAKYLGYNKSTDQYTLELIGDGEVVTRGVINIYPRF
ncbi:hypothetical protein [Leptospira licerasiae]|uniref:hypothetical protein n=1 Tax=Leptospira licerasiae TaxID=447106 RepID=UPI0030169DC7